MKVIFYFLPDDEKFNLEEDKLLALFKMRDSVKIDEVQAYLNVSRNTATRKLKQLSENGLIKRVGKGPAVRYVKAK